MVSRLDQQHHEAQADDRLPVDAGLPEPDRQLIEQAQAWFRETFADQLTPRAERAWRVARMLADIQAHPACPAVALLRAVAWEKLRPAAIVRTLPEGVYLTSVKQTDKRLKFDGIAQSSTRVSTFMRNIDASQWLRNPELEVVQTSKGSGPGSSFTLTADQVTTAGPDNGVKAAKAKVRKASLTGSTGAPR